MCGIFGLSYKEINSSTRKQFISAASRLFKLSESRGKEASGLALLKHRNISVLKRPVSASILLKSKEYRDLVFSISVEENRNNAAIPSGPTVLIGHSRLVTDGAKGIHGNNQPIISERMVGIHNGIIVNHADLWKLFPDMRRKYQLDSEVIFSLIRRKLNQSCSLAQAVGQTFELIYGQASIAALFCDLDCLLLYTNNGSLHIASNYDNNFFVFASERYMLTELLRKNNLINQLGEIKIQKIQPTGGLLINLNSHKTEWLGINEKDTSVPLSPLSVSERIIVDIRSQNEEDCRLNSYTSVTPEFYVPNDLFNEFDCFRRAVSNLRRCTKCLLPETMPFITFDNDGICNYCHNYKSVRPHPRCVFEDAIKNVRKKNSEPDCLVGLSGGRDSSYALHYIKTELEMNPITFTYDWGMVTDLARRNISRMCCKLGIEHILVSADIKQKRKYIRKNVISWLKRPDLGLVPLFMAGDKQYFYYANKIKQRFGVGVTFLGENLLERTDFKWGYCGIPPGSKDENRVYIMSAYNKAKLSLYYGKSYLLNPAFLNASIFDTIKAFVAYYIIPRDYINIYRYIQWDEDTVNSVIINEYDWEVANDTSSTWRIGDGTASFYNYIYYTVGGFSEIDTFRSNQIREGLMSRKDALELVEKENQPRWESIKWYCDTVGIEFYDTLKKINSIRKLYEC